MCAVDFCRENAGGVSYNRALNPNSAGENGSTQGNLSISGDGNDTEGVRYYDSSIASGLYRN